MKILRSHSEAGLHPQNRLRPTQLRSKSHALNVAVEDRFKLKQAKAVIVYNMRTLWGTPYFDLP